MSLLRCAKERFQREWLSCFYDKRETLRGEELFTHHVVQRVSDRLGLCCPRNLLLAVILLPVP